MEESSPPPLSAAVASCRERFLSAFFLQINQSDSEFATTTFQS